MLVVSTRLGFTSEAAEYSCSSAAAAAAVAAAAVVGHTAVASALN